MGGRRTQVDNVARTFARKIRVRFRPEKIILFGSRAAGTAWAYSDYDFIIVSDNFRDVHWLDRISLVVSQWTSDRPIDVLPYTPEEFRRKQKESGMIMHAVRKGIEI